MQTAQARIALIEDDPDTIDLVEAFFRPRGYEIRGFPDGGSAMSTIGVKENFDLIITDLKLPDMTGIEITRHLRELEIQIPIIVMTANRNVETAVEAINAGAYDFVVKPIHFHQLLISVQRAIALNQIREENQTLRKAVEVKEFASFDGVIAKSEKFKQVLDLARRVAKSSANVFINGESGTGKEVIAKSIHAAGPRSSGPFIAINCSAIPENLLESELFGHAKGSFTGAIANKTGLFEEADGGTLFLDEIGDLSPTLQAKLLRVLQERKIKRIGENQDRSIDVRIISATHKELRAEVEAGRFREDLFYRLNVIPIRIPPLRERPEDIVPLAEFFLKKFSALNRSQVRRFSKPALEHLMTQPWVGNVRELENAVERAIVLCESDTIEIADLPSIETPFTAQRDAPADAASAPFKFDAPAATLMTLDELVKKYILFALEKNNGIKEKTAHELGIDRKTLYRKLQEYKAAATDFQSSGAELSH